MYEDYDYTRFEGLESDLQQVIYLELEGVLNSSSYFQNHPDVLEELQNAESPGEISDPSTLFDPGAVGVLNQVEETIDPTIVLTSSWRDHFGLPALESFLEQNGFTGSIDAVILQGDQLNTGKNEIIMWSEQELEPDQFLVIDSRELRGIENLYIVDSQTGLTDHDADRIIEHFEQ